MRVNLEVPFNERFTAKAKGAFWDDARKIWYVIDPENMAAFLRWIPKSLKKPTTSTPLAHPKFKRPKPVIPTKKKKKVSA